MYDVFEHRGGFQVGRAPAGDNDMTSCFIRHCPFAIHVVRSTSGSVCLLVGLRNVLVVVQLNEL